MSKPTRMQMNVLATASAHPDGAIILPARLKGAAARAFAAALIDRGYASDAANTGVVSLEATDGDGRGVCPLVITTIGRRVIRCEAVAPVSVPAVGDSAPAAVCEVTVETDNRGSAQASAETAPPPTKQALVINLLARPGGASLTELASATGWLPHTVRAALVRLRQKGRTIERAQDEDQVSRYRLAATAEPLPAPSVA